jgi:hypothetical protein
MDNFTDDIKIATEFYKNRSLSDKLKFEEAFGSYLVCCEKTICEKEQKKCIEILKDFNSINKYKHK